MKGYLSWNIKTSSRQDFSYAFNFNYRTEYPSKWVKFIEEGIEQKEFSVAAAEIKLRYAPNERYYQTKSSRIPHYQGCPRSLPYRIKSEPKVY